MGGRWKGFSHIMDFVTAGLESFEENVVLRAMKMNRHRAGKLLYVRSSEAAGGNIVRSSFFLSKNSGKNKKTTVRPCGCVWVGLSGLLSM